MLLCVHVSVLMLAMGSKGSVLHCFHFLCFCVFVLLCPMGPAIMNLEPWVVLSIRVVMLVDRRIEDNEVGLPVLENLKLV